MMNGGGLVRCYIQKLKSRAAKRNILYDSSAELQFIHTSEEDILDQLFLNENRCSACILLSFDRTSRCDPRQYISNIEEVRSYDWTVV
ncbi:hypothetical protein ACOME3_004237 [Neoechinorhynchus agilis]